MITVERVEKSLAYLATTDADVAEAEGEMLRAEYRCDLIKDRIFLTATGTVAERQAKAGSANELAEAQENYIQALITVKKLKAKRQTEDQVIQVWRSQESSRRQGSI
jgi:hypothetical protein